MKVKILRQHSPFSEPYWESFIYEGPADNTIAGLLDYINYNDDIVNTDGNKTGRIAWECSCLQAVCGSCAMVINGRPSLACETFLKDLKGDEIVIKPLSKFPVISDLVVDRASIFDSLKDSNAYIEEFVSQEKGDHNLQYASAKCLKCGLCLEVCPNYGKGQRFYGATFANDCYLIYLRSNVNSKDIRKEYVSHFGNACSKSFSCMTVCPAGIPLLSEIAVMNR